MKVEHSSETDSLAYEEWAKERSDVTNVNYVELFINNFQPVAYCRPTVMCLCCNVRQRKPLNVPQ